MNTTSEAIF
jgi:hypothetical protein